MKKLLICILILTGLNCLQGNIFAQDTLRISGTQYVKKGETLTFGAGKVLYFEPGATLQIEGSIDLEGTREHPVILISANRFKPGVGLLISGKESEGVILISHVKFESLLQPMHFDPFWYRKEVNISNTVFSGSLSGEPVLYVSKPILDLREGKDIAFNMENIESYNNSGNFLLEAVGADGIIYSIDGLLFIENNIQGDRSTLGVLHFDCNSPIHEAQVNIGKLAFLRNFAGKNEVGLSVGGGLDVLTVNEFYQNNKSNRLIYDRQVNNRIPNVDVVFKNDISDWDGANNFVRSVSHSFGEVVFMVQGYPRIKELRDSLENLVISNQIKLNDTLILTYKVGNPAYALLFNGIKIFIPKLTEKELPVPIYKKPGLNLISPVWPDSTLIRDSTHVAFWFKIPTFGGKNKKLISLRFWEIGSWFGGGVYCGADLKHRYGPQFPSTIEYSGGFYGQYNINNWFSVRATLYLTTISMHNPWAAGQFSGISTVYSVDKDYNKIDVGWSYDHMFSSKMQILEFQGLWYLKNYSLAENQQAKLIPAIEFGAGIFHFTPYRYIWEARDPEESVYQWRQRIYKNNRVNLRELGTEGQNFLPGAKRYSSIAVSSNFTFSLCVLMKNWSVKGEAKVVLTSTDYLDDFGPGLWYGGDFNKLIESAKETTNYSDQVLSQTLHYDDRVAPNARRSTNNFTDAYFQFHLGISYFIGRKK
ncbi:MAG: hypothetical protein Q8M15_14055 [Bacteroidota bacterium]|nr:hypothetical protein [Bacteroidota bacterium]